MITLLIALYTACALASGAAAQDRKRAQPDVVCGAEWVTFRLPGIPKEERGQFERGVPIANHPRGTVLTIPKRAVRNVIYYPDTGGGEIVFFLETGSTERPRVYYSGLVTGQVYQDLLQCLD